ncbi:trafficking protein particle complex subunit 6A isoform X12 [Equus quagga]|uniref:trafficking protein particle complex subunit 6A isoform X12 n=1 Tax=Equus quagga TaxID=89248 RepID=UPI001EE2F223|nr:trafficking protein particle complex subunit 6A isoform X12 [Equus quagga]
MIPTPAPGFTESSGTLESRPPLAQHPLPVLLGAEPCVCGRSAGPPPPRSCLPPRALHLSPLCLPTQGQNMSLSVLEGMGFRVGQALGERLSRETLAYREELDILKFLCKDLWMAVFQKQMDSLRTNHQASPLPRGPTSCRTTVSPSSSGWPQACSIWRKHPSDLCPPPPVPGLHLRPPAWHPLHPGRQEPGHRLRGSPACL